MIGEIPTRLGDVLVLTTEGAGSIHQVCPVSADGQQGCVADRHTVSGRPAAVAKARSLVVPGGCIFLKDQDSGDWAKIPN